MREAYNSFLESGELFEFGLAGDDSENEFTGVWEKDKDSFKAIYTTLLISSSEDDSEEEDYFDYNEEY